MYSLYLWERCHRRAFLKEQIVATDLLLNLQAQGSYTVSIHRYVVYSHFIQVKESHLSITKPFTPQSQNNANATNLPLNVHISLLYFRMLSALFCSTTCSETTKQPNCASPPRSLES